jgi:BASS family bile acid:Na+ symporter
MPLSLQSTFAIPVRALAWLGDQGTRAVAALVVFGIAIPPLGALLRPYVTEAIFLLLCISFMRVDLAALRYHLRRPGLILAATAWTTIGVPLMFGLAAHLSGFDTRAPDLFLALMLQAVASPMMASPAIAALMGLDATLVLVTLVTSTALVPFTASLFAGIFLAGTLGISPIELGLKLLAILAGSLLVATVIRWIFGADAIRRHRRPIDGFNIIILLVFVAAVMGNVISDFLADPVLSIAVALLSFAIFFALLIVTTLLFRRIGYEQALALGMMVSQRNLGLMLAATAGALPAMTWLYFALTQFPYYIAPQLLAPIAKRLTARSQKAAALTASGAP